MNKDTFPLRLRKPNDSFVPSLSCPRRLPPSLPPASGSTERKSATLKPAPGLSPEPLAGPSGALQRVAEPLELALKLASEGGSSESCVDRCTPPGRCSISLWRTSSLRSNSPTASG